MKVELELEEAREVLACVVDRIIGEAGLTETDRAALRRWRSELKAGSPGTRELTAALNADLARTLENKKRSAVIKPDWKG